MITSTHISLALGLITAIVSLWNAWHNLAIGKIVAELQLNIRREFNGRYITLDRFQDLKERVEHLEEVE